MGGRVVYLAPHAMQRKPVADRASTRGIGVEPTPALAQRRPALPVFATGRGNRCPDCLSEAFNVGRVTAECGGCGLPLAIVDLRRLS